MKVSNLVGGIIVIIITTIFFYQTFSFPSISIGTTGPAFMPRIFCILLYIFSLLLIFEGIGKNDEEKAPILYPLIFIGIMAAYVLLVPYLGFYFMTLVFIVVSLLFARRRDWKVLLIVPLATNMFVYVFFTRLLNVNVPAGSLFF